MSKGDYLNVKNIADYEFGFKMKTPFHVKGAYIKLLPKVNE